MMVIKEYLEFRKSYIHDIFVIYWFLIIEEPRFAEQKLNILNAHSGSGVKAVRILKEINNEDIERLVMVDTVKTFPDFLKLNSLVNGLTEEQKAKIICIPYY